MRGVGKPDRREPDYGTARRFASQAFDVIAMLATRQAEAAERLMTLFYSLQIPVETELDPSRILPAADSGLGRDTVRQPPGGR